jgi:hypothetical protein
MEYLLQFYHLDALTVSMSLGYATVVQMALPCFMVVQFHGLLGIATSLI